MGGGERVCSAGRQAANRLPPVPLFFFFLNDPPTPDIYPLPHPPPLPSSFFSGKPPPTPPPRFCPAFPQFSFSVVAGNRREIPKHRPPCRSRGRPSAGRRRERLCPSS